MADINHPPTLNHNFGIGGDAGTLASVDISPMILDYNDVEQSDSEITYTITSSAPHGSLLKNGSTLGTGGSFTQDDINNHRITFSSTYVGTVSESIGFVVSDGAGGETPGALRFSIVDNTIHVPTLSVNTAATYAEGAVASTLSNAVALSDWPETLTSASISIHDFVAGDLLAVDTAGTSISWHYDSAGTLTLTGSDTLAHYEAVLESARFSSTSDDPTAADAHSSREIVWTAESDSYTVSAETTSSLHVAAINDAPENIVPSGLLSTAGTGSTDIFGLSVRDVDAGGAVEATHMSVAHGTLTVLSGGGSAVAGNGTNTITITGTLASINAALAKVVYHAEGGFAGADTLTITTNDGGHTGTGGALEDTDSLIINNAPQGPTSGIVPYTVIDPEQLVSPTGEVWRVAAVNYFEGNNIATVAPWLISSAKAAIDPVVLDMVSDWHAGPSGASHNLINQDISHISADWLLA